MTAKVFEHPFDLTKVRLQSQVLDATARFNGPLDCLVQTWTKEGIRGLYRVRVRLCLSAAPLSCVCGCARGGEGKKRNTDGKTHFLLLYTVCAGPPRADRGRHGRKRLALPRVQRAPERTAPLRAQAAHRGALPRPARRRRRRRRRVHELRPVRLSLPLSLSSSL